MLNSYHPGFTWTDNEMRGISSTLEACPAKPQIQVEYMDAKRHKIAATGKMFANLLEAKSANQNYPVVITTDNLALELALKLRPRLFPSAAIVFCGLNGPPEDTVGDNRNVTGVCETWDPAGTLRAIARLQPRVKDIVVLHDYTESGLGTRENLDAALPEFKNRFRFSYLPPLPTDAILNYLGHLPKTAAVLLMGFNIDSQGRVFDSAATGPMFARAASVPVYTMDQTRFSGGVVGGSLLAGERQGEMAAKLALRILAGEQADAITIIREPVAVTSFDYNALKRFNLPLKLLPPGSRILNRPLSIYEQYRYQIWALTAVIFALLCAVLGLTFVMFSRRRMYAERLAAAEALRVSEEKYRKIFEDANDGIYQTSPDGRYLSINPANAYMFGYSSPGEMMAAVDDIGTEIFVDQHDRERIRNLLIPNDRIDSYETKVRRRDGGTFWVSLSIHTVRDSSGAILYYEGRCADITARKAAEEKNQLLQSQLVQAQKLESIGRLAGGVAHDFNNLLSVIMGYTELLRLDTDQLSPKVKDALEEIWDAGGRAKDLTRQLLTFARKQAVNPKLIDLNETVGGMLKMLQRLIGENIELRWQPTSEPCPVKIDPSQVDQILANLVVNARDAITSSGRITIKTARAAIDEAYCATRHDCSCGDYIQLTVNDTGCGNDNETIINIFEPFFTTKADGHGTGLGLATVYGIVKQNGGFIEVESVPGQGATFIINLPSCDEDHSCRLATETALQAPGSGATILLVEDDESVLNLAKAMLTSLGYRVFSATTTEQALSLAERHSSGIDLLLSDIVMPGLNGQDLAGLIKAANPKLKCLYMSGYSADMVSRQIGPIERSHCVQKPFTLSELSHKVKQALIG